MQYEPIIVVPPHHITVPTVYKQVHTHNLIKKNVVQRLQSGCLYVHVSKEFYN